MSDVLSVAFWLKTSRARFKAWVACAVCNTRVLVLLASACAMSLASFLAALPQALRESLAKVGDDVRTCDGYIMLKDIHNKMQDTDYLVRMILQSGITASEQMSELLQRRRELQEQFDDVAAELTKEALPKPGVDALPVGSTAPTSAAPAAAAAAAGAAAAWYAQIGGGRSGFGPQLAEDSAVVRAAFEGRAADAAPMVNPDPRSSLADEPGSVWIKRKEPLLLRCPKCGNAWEPGSPREKDEPAFFSSGLLGT